MTLANSLLEKYPELSNLQPTETGPQQSEVRPSTLGKVLNYVSRPGFSTVGAIYEPLKEAERTGRLNPDAFIKGFTQGLGGKEYTTKDVFKVLGAHETLSQYMTPEHARWFVTGAGFVGDVMLDWSNLLGFGVGKKLLGKGVDVGASTVGKAFAGPLKPFAEVFKVGWGMAPEYNKMKYFARHALAGELKSVIDDVKAMAKLVPEAAGRERVMRALGHEKVALLTDEERNLFSVLHDKLTDIGQKYEAGGFLNEQSLKSFYDPRYIMVKNQRTGKFQAVTTGPHGIPAGLFGKTATPGGLHERSFDNFRDLEKYVSEISGAHGIEAKAGLDPIMGFAIKASEQSRFLANHNFVQATLEKFGKRVDPKELGGLKPGTLEYKLMSMADPEHGFYLPKGSMRFFSSVMLPAPKVIKAIEEFGSKASSLEGKQNFSMIRGLYKGLRDAGYSPGEVNDILKYSAATKGVDAEGILKEVQTLRTTFRTVSAMSKKQVLGLDEMGSDLFKAMRTFVGVSKNVPVYQLNKAMAKDLNKLALFESDEGMSQLMRHFDAGMNWWKAFATSTLPNVGFHVRNVMSNMYNMWLGDMNPAVLPLRLKQAMHVQIGGHGLLKTSKGTYTFEQIRQLTDSLGSRGRGWVAGDVPSYFQNELEKSLRGGSAKWTERISPFSQEFELSHRGRQFGTALEDNSRVGLFIDRLVKGDSPQDAALHVKKYLFDYTEATESEKKYLVRMFPFYKWMRKNIPLQFEMLLRKPQKYAQTAKFLRGVGYMEPETDEEKTFRPEYFDDLNAVKTPFKTFISRNPLYWNPNLPFQDMNRLGVQDFLSSMTPVAKIALELMPTAFGKPGFEAFSKRKIYKYPGDRDPLPAGFEVLGQLPQPMQDLFGIGPTFSFETGDMVPGMDARLLHVVKAVNPWFINVGKAYPPSEDTPESRQDKYPFNMLSWLGGVKLMPLDVAKAQTVEIFKNREKYMNMRKFLKYEGATIEDIEDFYGPLPGGPSEEDVVKDRANRRPWQIRED